MSTLGLRTDIYGKECSSLPNSDSFGHETYK